MKISGISTVCVGADMRNWVFVQVHTDEGLVGVGEASLEWKTQAVVGAVADLEPYLLGEDPCRIEHLWQTMVRQPFFQPGVVAMSAVSGIEQGLWDILGKSLGVPVYRLLGGAVRDSVRMYDHLGGGEMASVYMEDEPQRVAERARECVAAGFDALKVLVVPPGEPLAGSGSVRRAVGMLEAIRSAVGDQVDIMVDFHGRTWPEMAIQYAQALAPLQPLFIEEPVLPGSVEALAQVSRASPVPVATGERLVGRREFVDLIQRRACAVLQPDLCHCGGLWEARKIAAMAETAFMAVAPHNPLGPVATTAAVHWAMATPNFLIQEAMRSDVPWRQDVILGGSIWKGGRAVPAQAPGLGVEVDLDAAARHPPVKEPLMRRFHADGSVADW